MSFVCDNNELNKTITYLATSRGLISSTERISSFSFGIRKGKNTRVPGKIEGGAFKFWREKLSCLFVNFLCKIFFSCPWE